MVVYAFRASSFSIAALTTSSVILTSVSFAIEQIRHHAFPVTHYSTMAIPIYKSLALDLTWIGLCINFGLDTNIGQREVSWNITPTKEFFSEIRTDLKCNEPWSELILYSSMKNVLTHEAPHKALYSYVKPQSKGNSSIRPKDVVINVHLLC